MTRFTAFAATAVLAASGVLAYGAPFTIDAQTDARNWRSPTGDNDALLRPVAVAALDDIGEILDIGVEQPADQPAHVIVLGLNHIATVDPATLDVVATRPTPPNSWADVTGWLRDLDRDGRLDAIMVRRDGGQRLLTIDHRDARPTRVVPLPDRPSYQRSQDLQFAVVRGAGPETTAIVLACTQDDAATFINLPAGTIREIDLPGPKFTQITEIRRHDQTYAMVARWRELSLIDHEGRIVATQTLDIRGHVIQLRPLRDDHALFQSPELVQATLFRRSPGYDYAMISVAEKEKRPTIEHHEPIETWDKRAALFRITRPGGSVCHATIASIGAQAGVAGLSSRNALISVWEPNGTVYRHALTGSRGVAAANRISTDARMISLSEHAEHDTLLVSWGNTLFKLKASDE